MLRINQLTGFGVSSGGPLIGLFAATIDSTPATSPSINVNVVPGLLVIAVTTRDASAADDPTSVTVNGQGAATQILADLRSTSGLALYYFDGNTTDGSQQIDLVYPSEMNSFTVAIWSLPNSVAADVLTSASGTDSSGPRAIELTYAGASNSTVLHANTGEDEAGSFTSEPSFTEDYDDVTGGDASEDHTSMFANGLGSGVAGGAVSSVGTGFGGVGIISAFVEIGA